MTRDIRLGTKLHAASLPSLRKTGSGKEVILAGVEWPPEPVIVRIEPHRGHRAVVELNYYDYFTAVFGRPPKILGARSQVYL